MKEGEHRNIERGASTKKRNDDGKCERNVDFSWWLMLKYTHNNNDNDNDNNISNNNDNSNINIDNNNYNSTTLK